MKSHIGQRVNTDQSDTVVLNPQGRTSLRVSLNNITRDANPGK
jgi:hypothetical protein